METPARPAAAPGTGLPFRWIAALTCLALLPFLAKPLHIDDPLFVWSGQALWRDPLHPYRTLVHWFETTQPMHEVMFNPPAVPAYVALVTGFFGAGERTLHLAFLLPALLLVAGTHRLARRWCQHPALAALAVAFSPGFLVSATNLMADVWAAALFTWSLLLWIEGIDRSRPLRILSAALLAGACILSKYLGVAVLPLMAAYALGRRASPRSWLPALLVPILLWGGYEVLMRAQVGDWPVRIAGSMPGQGGRRPPVDLALLALACAGGAALAPLLLSSLAARSRGLLASFAGSTTLIVIALHSRWSALQHPVEIPGSSLTIACEFASLAALGLATLVLAARSLCRTRTLESFLLGLWTLEILAFASFLNWTTHARAFLPVLPPLAILACRAIEATPEGMTVARRRLSALVLVLSAAVGIELNVADLEIAVVAKRAAESLVAEERVGGRTVWFQGHWGFQYYAQLAGAKPMEKGGRLVVPGDRVIVPMLNANVIGVAQSQFQTVKVQEFPLRTPVTTLSRAGNAAFYASTLGILPFGYGYREPAQYWVFQRR